MIANSGGHWQPNKTAVEHNIDLRSQFRNLHASIGWGQSVPILPYCVKELRGLYNYF